MRRITLSILLSLLLGIAAFATPSRPTSLSPFYLPLIGVSSRVVRGSAGCYADGSDQVDFCYRYWGGWNQVSGLSYEVVPLLSSRLLAMAGVSVSSLSYPSGEYILVMNEPDNSDPNAGDGLTPAQGATFLHSVIVQLPSNRLICCSSLWGVGWMDAMLASYQSQYNANALDSLAGVSYHNYASIGSSGTEVQIVTHWVTKAQTWQSWIASKNGAYPSPNPRLETFLTEFGWHPSSEPDIATATRHMQLLCAQVSSLNLTRYSWFFGASDSIGGTQNISLFNVDKTLSPLGVAYSNC